MKIHVLLTGGTFLSVPNANGALVPVTDIDEFLTKIAPTLVRPFKGLHEIIFTMPFSIDSSAVNLQDWNLLTKEIHRLLHSGVDGIVIVNGTDTMEETAPEMRFRFLGVRPGDNMLNIPIVFTGAMRSVFESGTDAISNFQDAIEAVVWAAENVIGDIMIAFGRVLMPAVRASKGDPKAYGAFHAPALVDQGEDFFHSGGLSANPKRYMRSSPWADSNPPIERHESGVVVINVKPGLRAEQLTAIIALEAIKVIILALPGDGNPAPHLLPAIVEAGKLDKPVIAISKSDGKMVTLDQYEAGQSGQDSGLIPGLDITSSCAVAKAEYLLRNQRSAGISSRIELFRRSMELSFANESSPKPVKVAR